MRKLRLGVIGCGVIGRVHLRSAARWDFIETVAVADRNTENARTAAETYGVAAVYDNGKALIDDPAVEAVVLATPAYVKAELALYALAKGKHVLLEKPTGMNAQEVEAVMRARGDLVVASCAARFRFLPSTQAIASFIRSGRLGELRSVRWRLINPAGERPDKPPFWRFNRSINGGGILMNWGTYDLDFLFGITDWKLQPREVAARVWTVPDALRGHVAPESDAETHVSAFIRCASGATVAFERGEAVAARADESWELIGDAGSLTFSMLPHDNKAIHFHRADPELGTVTEVIWQGDENYSDIEYLMMSDFAESALEGKTPMGALEQALVVQSLIDAIYESSRSGQAVTLSS